MAEQTSGAQKLLQTAVDAGIELVLANPGTTEMPMVAALDQVSGLRSVLCLHENVATGAADGYARMAGKAAMTILHLGPGFSNGLSNLHNARRAGTPVINVIGDHATWHWAADPPLHAPIEQLADTVSGLVRQNLSADMLSADMADVIYAAHTEGGQVATLIAPHDAQTEVSPTDIAAVKAWSPNSFGPSAVEGVVSRLKAGKSALFLGGDALLADNLKLAGRVAQATGALLLCDSFFARHDRGSGLPKTTKIPYFPEQAQALLADIDAIVLIGTKPPVAFFGYPDGPSVLSSDEQVVDCVGRDGDITGALQALCEAVDAPAYEVPQSAALPDMPAGSLDAEAVAKIIARLQPDNCIMMDEAITGSAFYHEASQGSGPFTHLQLTGGAIGMGPGAATGAALACPDRQVINLQADGSGAYSVQALWTQARENLDVITVILSNQSYAILDIEMARAGLNEPGPAAQAMSRLQDPAIDWASITRGFGVQACTVSTAEAFAEAFEEALAGQGPRLIEAQLT